MGDPGPGPLSKCVWLLPSHRCICSSRIAQFGVRVLLSWIEIVTSLRQNSDLCVVINLMTLSSGEPHPAAQYPTLHWRRDAMVAMHSSVSVTNSRLAVFVCGWRERCLVIWNWKSGRILFVRQSFRYSTKNSIVRLGAGRGALSRAGIHR